MIAIYIVTTLFAASLLLVPFACGLTRRPAVPTSFSVLRDSSDRFTRLRNIAASSGLSIDIFSSMALAMDTGNSDMPKPAGGDASGMPPPPAAPHHRPSISTNQVSPRADTFKRMSAASITTPLSPPSTRPNSMITTFTEEPSELSSPVSRRSFSVLTVEPNAFLTAVAAQERRVLELKEDLQKAEADLQLLKTHWAQQEATKKRHEIRQDSQNMRPLTSPVRSVANTPVAENFRQSLDDERRKALFTRPRVPERKVLTGRHARTLSLLSPGALANRNPVQDGTGPKEPQSAKAEKTPALLGSTDGDGILETTSGMQRSGRPHADSRGTRDDLVNTGRQFVGDLREGLWSFLDDLRQATVGEEALKEPPAVARRPSQQSPRPGLDRRTSSSTSLQKPPIRRSSRSPHARSNTVVGAVMPATPDKKSSGSVSAAEGDLISGAELDDGGWSNWDSPAGKTVASTADTGNSPVSTPRTSVSSTNSEGKKDGRAAPSKTNPALKSEQLGLQSNSAGENPLPWPSLNKLRPGNLQRTASNLMREWERSLTPPAEEAEKDWIDRYIDGPRSGSTPKKPGLSRTSSSRSQVLAAAGSGKKD